MRMESVQWCCLFSATPTGRHGAIPSGHKVYSFPGRRSSARDFYFRVWYFTVHIAKKTQWNTAHSHDNATNGSSFLTKVELIRLIWTVFRVHSGLSSFELWNCRDIKIKGWCQNKAVWTLRKDIWKFSFFFFWIIFITTPIKFWKTWLLCTKQTQIEQTNKHVAFDAQGWCFRVLLL